MLILAMHAICGDSVELLNTIIRNNLDLIINNISFDILVVCATEHSNSCLTYLQHLRAASNNLISINIANNNKNINN
jgi:hypothetical protein